VTGAYSVSISPDATSAYVIGNRAEALVWTLSRVDLATGAAVEDLALDDIPAASAPSGPVVTPTGRQLLIGTVGLVIVVDVESWTITRRIPISPPERFALALTPDGRTGVLSSEIPGSLRLLELASGEVQADVPLPAAFVTAVTPDGESAYTVQNFLSSVTRVDLGSATTSPPVPIGFPPGLIDIDPDGTTALLGGNTGVYRLNLAAGTLSDPTPTAIPLWQTITPDGQLGLVVTQAPATLTTIDMVTGEAGTPIPLPGTPLGVGAVGADQAPVADLTVDPKPAGEPTPFNASGSTTRCGRVETYTWDFGDGTPEVTSTSAEVDHTYAAEGSYTATLTVTNTAGTSTEQVYANSATSRNGGPQATTAAIAEIPAAAPSAVVATPAFTG
jgi:hypothetical protein